jgi:Tol biopolymer transport system component
LNCPLVFSPDGRTLYHSNDQIVAIDLRSKRVRRVTNFKGSDRYGVFWHLFVSPDGEKLYFKHDTRTRRVGIKRSRICSIRSDGTDFRVIFVPPAETQLWHFSCDFDDETISALVYDRSEQPPRQRRFALHLDGSNVRSQTIFASKENASPEQGRYLADPMREPSRGVSPDGSAVAFLSEDRDLCIRKLGGAAVFRIVVRKDDPVRPPSTLAWDPTWSSDGRFLWFSLVDGTRGSRARYRFTAQQLNYMKVQDGYSDEHIAERIERAYWRIEHHVGIIDWIAGTVAMSKGTWTHVAWAPEP